MQTERQGHRKREKQAPCREPDVGLDPGTPGSCSKPKADTRPLSHPGTLHRNILKASQVYYFNTQLTFSTTPPTHTHTFSSNFDPISESSTIIFPATRSEVTFPFSSPQSQLVIRSQEFYFPQIPPLG